MAKWDERDPRWLVEHREDGKNVNSWHWEETNKLDWSKQRLEALLTGLAGADGGLRITKLKTVTGEAMLTKRKANKKFAIYDLQLAMDWEAPAAEAGSLITGEIRIDDFASTSEPEEYQYTVSVNGSGATHDACKAVAMALQHQVYEQLASFVLELNELSR